VPRKPQEPEAPLKDPAGVSFFSIGAEDFVAVALGGAPSQGLSTLSAAETGVLAELVAGRSNQAIAAARGTSVRTVTNQVSAVFRKLGVQSRAELVLLLAAGGGTSE
jgi:DNA-binding NarL/FixJ family response regulator